MQSESSGEEEEVPVELTEEEKLKNKIKELEEQVKQAKSKPIEVEVPKEVKKKKGFWGKAKKYGDDVEKGIKDLDID